MDDSTLVALRLAKEGFGTIEALLETRVDLVLDALEFAGFLSEYQQTYVKLNQPDHK